MKKFFKKAVLLFILSFSIGILAVPIAASTSAQSDIYYYGPVKGYYYMNTSFVTVSSYARAYAAVGTQDGDDVPTGYMGVKVMIYQDDECVYTSGYKYNSDDDDYLQKYTSSYSQSGSYYAKGKSRAYNGNGYNTYSIYASPAVNLD